MAIVRWDPVRELDSFQSDMNRLFDGFFGGQPNRNGGHRRWIPPMDLVESDGDLVLRADLPGMDESDINIEVKDNALTITGERKSEHETGREGFYRVERAVGAFARTLSLPEGVDADAISADFDRGVLEVRIPKPAESKARRIAVGGSAEQIEEESHDG